MVHVEDLLRGMRSQKVQDEASIRAFVAGVVDGTISRPQAAAWLAWAFARTLSDGEAVALTRAMTESGAMMSWPDGSLLVDKHSTGGVGDKVSLVLAPLWAELGLRVPMISGRGLGHTGGTLDKLEAIPGFRTDLPGPRLGEMLAEHGCFLNGQTAELAPADRILYALRNETQTVESIPLIVASILSKKIAEGSQRLVLDVKCGSGAFMRAFDDAHALASALVRVAEGAGVRCSALITEMGRPLGEAVGNAVEVEEAVACLKGGGPADLREITLELAGHPGAAAVLDSGRAYERFCRIVAGHGGDVASLEDPKKLRDGGADELVIEAPRAGYLQQVDAWGVGRAAFVLGAGRRRAEDPVDFGVGLWVWGRPGQRVEAGQPLVRVLHRGGRALEEARAFLDEALVIGDEPAEVPPLIRARIGDGYVAG
jgi:pyrimidine-nucleoside phosphorylase